MTQAKKLEDPEYKTRIPRYMLDHSCSRCGKESFSDICPSCDLKNKKKLILDILKHEQSCLTQKPDFNLECKIHMENHYLVVQIKSSIFNDKIRARMTKPKSLIKARKLFRTYFPNARFILYVQACNIDKSNLAIRSMDENRINVQYINDHYHKGALIEEWENIKNIFFELDSEFPEKIKNDFQILKLDSNTIKEIMKDETNRKMIQHNLSYQAIQTHAKRDIEQEKKFLAGIWEIAIENGYTLNINDSFMLKDKFSLEFINFPTGDFSEKTTKRSRKNRNK